jgi:hypothetical protein
MLRYRRLWRLDGHPAGAVEEPFAVGQARSLSQFELHAGVSPRRHWLADGGHCSSNVCWVPPRGLGPLAAAEGQGKWGWGAVGPRVRAIAGFSEHLGSL